MGVRADDYPGLPAHPVPAHQHPRRARHDAAQGHDGRACVDEVSTAGQIAGACNAILLRADGSLLGDMFDGEGFVRGMLRKGRAAAGASALVVGSGGVGCAIAASLAGAGVARLGLFDVNEASAQALADTARDALSRPRAGRGLERSCRLRDRRQCNAARDEARRPASRRRRRGSIARPSSARSS